MSRIRISLVAATAALALLAATPANAATRLVATVGPGFTITLKTTAGKKVTSLKHGSYTFLIHDKSDDHNFHLRGPRLNRVFTSVDFVGKKTVTVTLRAGKYTFVCDPHVSGMRGTFRVT